MLFPIGDTQVRGGHRIIFAYLFILFNVGMWVLQLMTPGSLVCELATIPRNIASGIGLHTLFTSMFLHGGWMHIIGNMLFLWVFADNIEAKFGSLWFVIFYLAGGLAASLFHVGFDLFYMTDVGNCCLPCDAFDPCPAEGGATPCPGSVPSLGASGAIAACLGAYIVMFPTSKIKLVLFMLIWNPTFKIGAIWFLGIWFLQQLFSGIGSIGMGVPGGGVAWWAHIGGFVFGLAIGIFYRIRNRGEESIA